MVILMQHALANKNNFFFRLTLLRSHKTVQTYFDCLYYYLLIVHMLYFFSTLHY